MEIEAVDDGVHGARRVAKDEPPRLLVDVQPADEDEGLAAGQVARLAVRHADGLEGERGVARGNHGAPGKRADLALWDVTGIDSAGSWDKAALLLAGPQRVRHLFVEGRQVVRDGQAPVSLSASEFKLLRYLMLNPNRVLSKAQILDHVWEYDFNGDAGIVESYISYLRRKIDPYSSEPLIQTKRGFGYMLKAGKSA